MVARYLLFHYFAHFFIFTFKGFSCIYTSIFWFYICCTVTWISPAFLSSFLALTLDTCFLYFSLLSHLISFHSFFVPRFPLSNSLMLTLLKMDTPASKTHCTRCGWPSEVTVRYGPMWMLAIKLWFDSPTRLVVPLSLCQWSVSSRTTVKALCLFQLASMKPKSKKRQFMRKMHIK